ncbi:hypothetical protein ACFV5G_28105 [Streptomyces sp. NPDC059766]|uniref:hypothetical protein n=1 Tax=Streptomyces sp. NPDC059766 TaxID=3346940 RepID=UPI0036695360
MSRNNLIPTDPRRLGAYWTAARLGSGGQGVVHEAYGAAGLAFDLAGRGLGTQE